VDEDLVADVMSTLRLIPRWRLGGDQWDAVGGSLGRLAEGMSSDDAPAVASALEEIERHGPSRLASIARPDPGAGLGRERTAPPEPVLEILNTLVHPAGGWTQGG
jgi:hypothetical protein